MVDCKRVVFVSRVSNRVVALSMGKVRTRDVLLRVAGQAWDFVALKRKLLRGALVLRRRAVFGQSEKGRCVVTCESAV